MFFVFFSLNLLTAVGVYGTLQSVADTNTRTAAPVSNAIEVIHVETLPDGVTVVIVPCADRGVFAKLPKAIAYGGEAYGRSGWNSDRCCAYYRSDRGFALRT